MKGTIKNKEVIEPSYFHSKAEKNLYGTDEQELSNDMTEKVLESMAEFHSKGNWNLDSIIQLGLHTAHSV